MKLQTECLGKVSITVEEDYWNIEKSYDKLTVVEVEGSFATYLSRKDVPAGIYITDREYWIPFSSLQESIVLDYNSFIDKYSKKINQILTNLKNIESRVDRLDDLKEYNEKLIKINNKLAQTIHTTHHEARQALCQANCIIRKVQDYIKKIGFKEIGDTLYIAQETLNVRHIPKSELENILI